MTHMMQKQKIPIDDALGARQRPKNSGFEGHAPKDEGARGQPKPAVSETLGNMKAAWADYQFSAPGRSGALKALEGARYSPQDVTEFTIAMKEFQGEAGFREKAGLFLSALINTGPKGTYVIMTGHLDLPPDFIGHSNEAGRGIIVEGNSGSYTGYSMNEGSITVRGSAGHLLGELMSGGSIIVEGDAGNSAGDSMSGGSITVKGNVGHSLGKYMKGGKITVNGNTGDRVGWDKEGGEIILHCGDRDSNAPKPKKYPKGRLTFS